MMNTLKLVITYFTTYNSENYQNNLHKVAELSPPSPTQAPFLARNQFIPLELMTHKLRSDMRKTKPRKIGSKKSAPAKKPASGSLSSSCVCLKRQDDSFSEPGRCSNLKKDIELCGASALDVPLPTSQMLSSCDDLPSTIGKNNWANGITEARGHTLQPHCRSSGKQNLKQISDSVVLANNGASCTNYTPVITHAPSEAWVPHTQLAPSQKGLYSFPNYKCPSAQSLTKRNGCGGGGGRQSPGVEDCGVKGVGGCSGGQISLLAALNGNNQSVRSIIPPLPPAAGSKNSNVMDEQTVLAAELHQLENEEEKHLRRMMHIDSSDDCTTLTRLFFQETSIVHGVARAAKVSSDYRRILWIILVLCSFSGFTLQTCSLLIDYFDWPVSVVTQMEDSRTLTFPAISICNMNKIKSSLLDNTRFASLYQLDKYAEEVIPSALSQYLTAKNETDNLLVCNKDTEWSCPGVHQCIPIEWRCNRNKDCMNGADEENCAECVEDFWELKCPGVEECMKVYDFCDGAFQCSDGSDEAVCDDPDFVCPTDKMYSDYLFQCHNTHRCIEVAWLGDGMDDCGDGEDEDLTTLESMVGKYPSNMYACGNDSHQHIMAGWECDSYKNCANGFDELNCQQNRTCTKNFYLCEEGYSCIMDNFLCDDFLDCVNGSDEKFENCAQRIDCEEEVGLERCERSTFCIPPEWECNGFGECLMGEEEDKFKCAEHQCLPGQVRCSNGSFPCIYEWQFCDGLFDCPAMVDEINCPPKAKLNCSEEQGRVACADNSRCIKKEWRCDGYQDCDTPVDERDCDVRVTCDDMKDDYKSCSRWAQYGFCELKDAHYTFMKDHCARTCQFCIKTQEDNENILGDKSDLVSNRQWRIYYDTSKHEDYSDVVDLGMMTRQEIKLLGHQQDEFIIQCTFDGKTCSKDWFKEFQNDMYGNCWTFNDGSQNTALWNISQAGVRHALQLTVFLDVANYLGILSHRTGARLSIQDPRVQPFPDELGITLTPGKHTSIGIRQQTLSRQTGRYGNCIKNWPEIMGYLNHTGYDYSYLGCSKVCIQEQLMAACGCVDSLLLENVTLCNIVNSTQDSCRKAVYDRYQSGEFGCECSQPCEEMVFTKIVSESTWPNTKYMHHMIRRLLTDESYLVRETTKDFLIPYVQARIDIMQRHKMEHADADKLPFNDTMYYRWFEREMMEMLRMNFLRVEVYFETLSYEMVREQPQYGWEHLLSNIGGALGLWLGLSIITVFEFCELIFDLHRIIISSRYKKRQNERKRIFTLNYRQRNAASLKQMNLHSESSLV